MDYVTERSTVRNLNAATSLHLNSRIKQSIFDFNVAANYLHATSPSIGFQDINSFDFKYSVHHTGTDRQDKKNAVSSHDRRDV